MLTTNCAPGRAARNETETDVTSQEPGFQSFAHRLHASEELATNELLERFSSRLLSLARSRLSPQLQPKADPEDVVQSVMRTFFRRLDRSEIELRDWPSLWSFLSLLTIRKCAMTCRCYKAARRDVGREIPLQCLGDLSIPSREPTPVEVSVFVNLLERLLESATERDRHIIEGMIAGESVASLSQRLGRTHRTIYRARERIRQNAVRMANISAADLAGAT